jgi:hypothetical protein
MSANSPHHFSLRVLIGFTVLLCGGVCFSQEAPVSRAATPEVRAATAPPAKKTPTLKELAQTVESLEEQIVALKTRIVALESRLQAFDAAPDPVSLERRLRTLEQAGQVDFRRDIGLPRGQTLEAWHRDSHRTDSRLTIPTQRDFESWHLRDHQQRGAILRR